MIPSDKSVLYRLKEASISFIGIALVGLLLLWFVRLMDILLNGILHEFPKDLASSLPWSLLMDLLFWFKCLLYIYFVYVFIFMVIPKIANTLFYMLIAFIILLQIGLSQYFNTALVPLGSDVYAYSIADIKQTVGASGGVGIVEIAEIILVILIIILSLWLLPKKIKMSIWLALAFPFLALLFTLTNAYSYIKPKGFSDFSSNLILNKTDYFLSSSLAHFFPYAIENDIYADSYIGDFPGTEKTMASFTYLDEANYSFLHQDIQQDVLSPFFKTNAERPNIVIILVEGLGRAFTNEGAYLGNFTPFLDSLSNESLYWKNFLSEGGRTFAVLPSVMGSLPFAKNGFLELGNEMPDHQSLFSLLKFNGYNTSFYYGGDSKFDNMTMFLKRNAVDQIKDEGTYPSGYSKLPAKNGFSWGYTDNDLFNYFLNSKNSAINKTPELSVILTVATHSPFLINEQDKYIDRFEKRMDELSFEPSKKEEYRNYKLQYATIMYTDNALRNFFNAFKKRPDYANTIFLITGDHRMPEIPMSTKIDRYHVPLIIHSPMLARKAKFASVSTHFDITPSLLSYLKSSYKLKLPSISSWMGQGLDTTRSFQNIHGYPLMQTKTDIVDFILGEYHLNGQSLFKIGSNMEEVPVEDVNKYNQLKNAFDQFKKRNNSSSKNIIPDSLYQNYRPLNR